jgi:GAF domain-containing protein
VAERTHQLARRARYLEATATVARDAAQELDIGELLSRVVQSISEHFGLYHAGIFFLDPAGEWLVLQAASSQGGQQMLARGHRLRIGEGIVGYAAQHRQYRLALDVGEDAVFFDNPDLPETRSEMALALQARAEVIGVLDVQSTEARAFSDEDVAALEALADQVALALSNARLFWEAQQALEAERKAYGEIGREAWQRVLHARPNLGYRYTERSVLPVGQADGEAAPRGRGDGNGEEMGGLSLPIRHLGQKLGTIVAHKPADAGDWTSQETELMEMLAEQLSLALDSARLYQETQRRAVQERLVGEATARMRETLDIETVLRTTASEMRQALDLDNLVIRLATPEPDGDAEAA